MKTGILIEYPANSGFRYNISHCEIREHYDEYKRSLGKSVYDYLSRDERIEFEFRLDKIYFPDNYAIRKEIRREIATIIGPVLEQLPK